MRIALQLPTGLHSHAPGSRLALQRRWPKGSRPRCVRRLVLGRARTGQLVASPASLTVHLIYSVEQFAWRGKSPRTCFTQPRIFGTAGPALGGRVDF